MKVLTLIQPWATLMVYGMKRIETRSWLTNYRGPIAIHASASMPKEVKEMCAQSPFAAMLVGLGIQKAAELPTGVILGVCQLVDCRSTESLSNTRRVVPGTREWALGDYTPGRFGFITGAMQRLVEPIKAKGALGLWDLDDKLLEYLRQAAYVDVT